MCVNQMQQIQALDRNQPVLPLHSGVQGHRYPDTVTAATAAALRTGLQPPLHEKR